MNKSIKTLLIGTIAFSLGFSFSAHAATLSFSSGITSASIGDTVDVSVRIDSQSQTVNAVQGTIDYPTDILQVVRIDHSNSIFNIWAQEPAVNTSTGAIAFLGGATNSFSGSSLYVMDITFAVRGTGLATLDFRNAGVTAGDGTGANILSSSTMMSFRVGTPSPTPSVVSNVTSTPTVILQVPPTPIQIKRLAVPTTTVPVAPVMSVGLYPDQNAWYGTSGQFLAQWQLPSDVTDVATALNQDPKFDPTVSEGLFDNKTFGAVKDGVWYLHVRFKNSVGWGLTTHYRIAIDTTPPFPFTATIKEGSMTQSSAPTVQFSTQDQPSGVAFYQILADGTVVGSTTETSFVVPSLAFGSHDLAVQAVDHAGNMTESHLSVTVAMPPFLTIAGIKITAEIFFLTLIAFILIGVGIGWWIGWREKLQRKNRVIIAGRDVTSAFGVVQKNLEKLSGYYDGDPTGALHAEDIKFLLKEMIEEVEKMKHYVSEDVEEVDQ